MKISEEGSSDLINILIDAYKSKLNWKLITQINSHLQSLNSMAILYVKSNWGKKKQK